MTNQRKIDTDFEEAVARVVSAARLWQSPQRPAELKEAINRLCQLHYVRNFGLDCIGKGVTDDARIARAALSAKSLDDLKNLLNWK